MVRPAFDMGLDGPANLQEFFTSKYRDLDLGPRFRLGHGLSYTRFAYTAATLSRTRLSVAELERNGLDVHLTVTNTGDRAGDDVVLVFLRDVVASLAPAVRQLAGWERVRLEPGASVEVTIHLDAARFTLWDEEAHGWRLEPGDFEVRLGEDPSATPLTVTVTP